ncbi:MAG: NAD(P)H-hydrate dehydratase [Nitrospinae bacterium]|nr:NAD(P)H-hydrate dehydratase [Nitrospinota bacterium]
MIKIVTAATMRQIDRTVIDGIGVPGVALMENAGRAVVAEIEKRFDSLHKLRVNIFAGKGNNGGDGFVVARHLFNRWAEPTVFLACAREAVGGDARINLDAFERMGGRVKEFTEEKHIRNFKLKFMHTSVVVDALLGSGAVGAPHGFMNDVLDVMNGQGKFRIAIDLPTGVEADSGAVPGNAFRAHVTVTFGAPKPALYTYPGAALAGEIVVADISIPRAVLDEAQAFAWLAEEKDIRAMLPRRPADGHKGTFGHALLACGAPGFAGTGLVAGVAALRMGAGLATVALPRSLSSALLSAGPELMTLPLPETPEGGMGGDAATPFLAKSATVDALLVGPGIGVTAETARFVERVVRESPLPLVLDADALTVMGAADWLAGRTAPTVVTPHPGEMGRLVGLSTEAVQTDRVGTAKGYAAAIGAVVVLKGARTVVAAPDGMVWINPTGNDALATGGTGDALAGMIVSLLAQGATPTNAAVAAVWLHGRAADQWRDGGKAPRAMLATDLLGILPEVL